VHQASKLLGGGRVLLSASNPQKLQTLPGGTTIAARRMRSRSHCFGWLSPGRSTTIARHHPSLLLFELQLRRGGSKPVAKRCTSTVSFTSLAHS